MIFAVVFGLVAFIVMLGSLSGIISAYHNRQIARRIMRAENQTKPQDDSEALGSFMGFVLIMCVIVFSIMACIGDFKI